MKILNVNFAFGTLSKVLNDELYNIKELKKRGHEVVMVTSDIGSIGGVHMILQVNRFLVKKEVNVVLKGISVYKPEYGSSLFIPDDKLIEPFFLERIQEKNRV